MTAVHVFMKQSRVLLQTQVAVPELTGCLCIYKTQRCETFTHTFDMLRKWCTIFRDKTSK